MRVGDIEVKIYSTKKLISLTKHHSSGVSKQMNLTIDDIYSLEFAIKEVKRKLDMK